jgi:squalene cyclase
MEYCQHEQSQVVMTAWAMLALIYVKFPDKDVIERGARLIMSRQKKDGRWEQEDTEGIFNKNCAIDYPCQSRIPLPAIGILISWVSFQVHFLCMGFGKGGQVFTSLET